MTVILSRTLTTIRQTLFVRFCSPCISFNVVLQSQDLSPKKKRQLPSSPILPSSIELPEVVASSAKVGVKTVMDTEIIAAIRQIILFIIALYYHIVLNCPVLKLNMVIMLASQFVVCAYVCMF